MSLIELIKLFTNKNYKKNLEKQYSLIHNQVELEKMVVFTNKLHHDTMKKLREFKTPQYDITYVLRNKSGFNTIGFNISNDVVLCDQNGKIINYLINVKPGFVSKHYDNCKYIYIMTTGSINFYRFQKNDVLTIGRNWI